MKDYYLLLGVNKMADKNEIKRAYRDSVKKCHPDGEEVEGDAKRFREVTEAYETLSDSDKRKQYDADLVDRDPVHSPENVNNLKPAYSQRQRGYDPNPYIRDCFNDMPLNFFRRDHVTQKTLKCEINLTYEDIQQDVQYPHTINIIKPCLHCNSLFSQFLFSCPYCNGSQYLVVKKELIINIPKSTQNGSCVHLDLNHVGLSDVKLVVKVFFSSIWEE